ncbi:MAG: hypothetical protein NC453_21180 [Muribaculum sp.]|nr:hypothetical protein [Muribaculum sp.]
MIHIDKLILAFKTRIQYHNKDVYQFEDLRNRFSIIDKEGLQQFNEVVDSKKQTLAQTNFRNYKSNRTELEWISLEDIRTHYRYNYYVIVDDKKIGVLQWETYGNGMQYGHLTLLNNTLYNDDWKLYKQAIKDLQLTINHISKLDIAYDSTINPTKRYLDIIKDKENEIIINGVKVKERNQLLESPYFNVKGTLDEPFKYPKIYFCTMDKSTLIRNYNKSKEIENSSHKEYIKNKFKDIKNSEHKDIYRCEVSLTSHSINRILEDISKHNNLDVETDALAIFLNQIEDPAYLLQLHKEAAFRLFRYSHKGKRRKTILSYYHI